MQQATTTLRCDAADGIAAFDAQAQRLGWPLRCDTDFVFEHPELNALHKIWTTKARDGNIPFRTDFSMQSLKPVISSMMIVERQTAGGNALYQIRLAGLNITEVFGEANGQPLDKSTFGKYASRWQQCIDVALDHKKPYRITGNFQQERANHLGGEIYLAPMRNSAGDVAMVLVVLYFKTRDEFGQL